MKTPHSHEPLIKGPIGQFLFQLAVCAAGALYYFAEMTDEPTTRGAVGMLLVITLGPLVSIAVLVRKLMRQKD